MTVDGAGGPGLSGAGAGWIRDAGETRAGAKRALARYARLNGPLPEIKAAVDLDDFSGDETGVVRSQKTRHGGDIVGFGQAPQRGLRHRAFLDRLRPRCRHRRLDDTGADRIDAHALRAERFGEGVETLARLVQSGELTRVSEPAAWQILSIETMYVGLLTIALIGFALSLNLDETEALVLPTRWGS